MRSIDTFFDMVICCNTGEREYWLWFWHKPNAGRDRGEQHRRHHDKELLFHRGERGQQSQQAPAAS